MEHSSIAVEPTNRGIQTNQISQRIVQAVADAEGVDQMDLTPLYTAIDPDALETLFEPQLRGASGRVHGEIRFSYHGYEVRVSAAGEVDLAPDGDR
jgi:hypothetical protein